MSLPIVQSGVSPPDPSFPRSSVQKVETEREEPGAIASRCCSAQSPSARSDCR
ncbi:hypothetical protein [Sorangium sp. So ce1099]|uniref:hypothetical protein n=1 Tax=Sorangium sp. So ce1099 TaxID=3133331 RepID=UPI003F623C7E